MLLAQQHKRQQDICSYLQESETEQTASAGPGQKFGKITKQRFQ